MRNKRRYSHLFFRPKYKHNRKSDFKKTPIEWIYLKIRVIIHFFFFFYELGSQTAIHKHVHYFNFYNYISLSLAVPVYVTWSCPYLIAGQPGIQHLLHTMTYFYVQEYDIISSCFVFQFKGLYRRKIDYLDSEVLPVLLLLRSLL